MRKGMKWICGAAVILMMAACNTRPADEWQLVWEENFDQANGLDTTNWSKIPLGHRSGQNICLTVNSVMIWLTVILF